MIKYTTEQQTVSQQPSSIQYAAQLPLTLIQLNDWSLARISGVDSAKYLHGQITADVLKLPASQHVLAAHCDAKGKMWSTLRLFACHDGFAWIQRRDLQASQLAELKKYAVFSKVSIRADDDYQLLALAGQGARAALEPYFSQLPEAQAPLLCTEHCILLWFPLPTERFLILCNPRQAQQLNNALADSVQQASDDQWLALDIEAGYPILDSASSGQFLPQACNLQVFGGISFKKGCYTGQEMVSRAKFRGANKRALWILHGNASRLPATGEDLEIELQTGNWRRTGSTLATVRMADNKLLVQAVLNNDLAADSTLRVRNSDHGTLHILPLPYSLEDNP